MDMFFAGAWGGVTACLAVGVIILAGKLRETLAALRVYESLGMRPLIATFTDQQITDLANQLMGRMAKKEWVN